VAHEAAGNVTVEYSTNASRSAWSSYSLATVSVPDGGNRAALVPFTDGVNGGAMGLMYFTTPDTLTFRIHDDDAGDAPGAWTTETADASVTAEDHICVRAHPSTGDVFAVVKDSVDDVILYKRPNGGPWGSETTVTSGVLEATRPQVAIDETNDEIYVFWTNWINGTIAYKKSTIDSLSFGTQKQTIGQPGKGLNNVQLPKHGVDPATDLLVTAANSTQTWYEILPIGGGDPTDWYRDADGDSFGDPDDSVSAEEPPPGYVGNSADCDDGNGTVYPGALQICDGLNNDCDDPDYPTVPADEADQDQDSYPICANDCDDEDPDVHPGATETCNQVDDDCDGLVDNVGDDIDDDGIYDDCDNCRNAFNPGQSDSDSDNEGDHCDLDDGIIYLMFGSTDRLDWQDEGFYTTWNVYTGDLDVLKSTGEYTQAPGSNPLADRDCGLDGLFTVDTVTPPAGKTAFFLVSGNFSIFESNLGTNSEGTARPNTNPCP
jgi:hypothetical protein